MKLISKGKVEILILDFRVLRRILRPTEIRNIYHFRSIKSFSIDSRSIRKGQGFIAIKGLYKDGHKFIKKAVQNGAAFVVAEKYVSTKPKVPFFVVENSRYALAQIAHYIRNKKNPFTYAITGSVGKTTTKEMLSFLLEPYYKVLKNYNTENNFFGLTKTILSLKNEKVMILEVGTSSKGEVAHLSEICHPDVGIITSIKPVHLEGLGDIEGVLEEKLSLLKTNLRMKVILNRDDVYLAQTKRKGKIYWYGQNSNNSLSARLVKREYGNSFFLIQERYLLALPIFLENFVGNTLAAILGANILGIPLKELVARINSFSNYLPMRMQLIELHKFSILNDAYNSNPYSFQQVLKNIKNYPCPKIAIVGDMLELGPQTIKYHRQLAPQIIKAGFDYCLTYGKYSSYLNNRLRELKYKNSYHFKSHEAIAQFIKKNVSLAKNHKKRYLIFLKGSRNMELERVIKYLRSK